MGANSKISWTHHTFNPWRGCTKVSEGCKNCYAETLSKRNPKVLGVWGPQGTRVMASEAMWREPLKWNEEARAAGERRRVFCASLADVFEGPTTCTPEAHQMIQEARIRLFELIAKTPHLDWLLLTKRPENIPYVLKTTWTPSKASLWHKLEQGFLPNIWLGTSVENQAAADERIPELLKVPAKVRFLSCEPLLGPVNLEQCAPYVLDGDEENPGVMNAFNGLCYHPKTCVVVPETKGSEEGIHWVIAGGESGPNARPMHPDWARSLRDQCQAAGVAFHFKQWGEWLPYSEIEKDPLGIIYPLRNETRVVGVGKGSDDELWRVGKAAAGRLLDGQTWDEVPEAPPCVIPSSPRSLRPPRVPGY
jgi:protein gp37